MAAAAVAGPPAAPRPAKASEEDRELAAPVPLLDPAVGVVVAEAPLASPVPHFPRCGRTFSVAEEERGEEEGGFASERAAVGGAWEVVPGLGGAAAIVLSVTAALAGAEVAGGVAVVPAVVAAAAAASAALVASGAAAGAAAGFEFEEVATAVEAVVVGCGAVAAAEKEGPAALPAVAWEACMAAKPTAKTKASKGNAGKEGTATLCLHITLAAAVIALAGTARTKALSGTGYGGSHHHAAIFAFPCNVRRRACARQRRGWRRCFPINGVTGFQFTCKDPWQHWGKRGGERRR